MQEESNNKTKEIQCRSNAMIAAFSKIFLEDIEDRISSHYYDEWKAERFDPGFVT
jgi:hypothetical protein